MNLRERRSANVQPAVLFLDECDWFVHLCALARHWANKERRLDGLPPERNLRTRLANDFRQYVELHSASIAKRIGKLFRAYEAALERWNEEFGRISTSP